MENFRFLFDVKLHSLSGPHSPSQSQGNDSAGGGSCDKVKVICDPDLQILLKM
jgi:hypothetical protein